MTFLVMMMDLASEEALEDSAASVALEEEWGEWEECMTSLEADSGTSAVAVVDSLQCNFHPAWVPLQDLPQLSLRPLLKTENASLGQKRLLLINKAARLHLLQRKRMRGMAASRSRPIN